MPNIGLFAGIQGKEGSLTPLYTPFEEASLGLPAEYGPRSMEAPLTALREWVCEAVEKRITGEDKATNCIIAIYSSLSPSCEIFDRSVPHTRYQPSLYICTHASRVSRLELYVYITVYIYRVA